MAKEDVRVYEERRSDRYSAMIEKVENLVETAEYYKHKPSTKIMNEVVKSIKEHTTKKVVGGDENKSTKYLYELNVEPNKQSKFIDSITSKIREANENIIELSLKETQDSLTEDYIKDVIDEIEEKSRDKYLNAVKLMTYLAKIKRINTMESLIFEISKDLRAIFEYDDKIKKTTELEISTELSDEFVEECEKEEELELVGV